MDTATSPVSLREAAKALGVAHTTLSRQVRAGKIPNRGTDSRPLVDVEEARAARASNIDPAMQRSPAPAPAATGLARIKERQAELDLARAEHAWQVEQRLWVKVADVASAIRTAGVSMRDELGTLAKRVAPDLAAETDPVKIRDRLTAEINAVLEKLTTAFEKLQADEQ